MSQSSQPRSPELLVAPLVTLASVGLLLIVARFYDYLPVHLPECNFKKSLGIPCVGCGGTRSMRALASGNFLEALRFNPAVVLGVLLSAYWTLSAIIRYRRGDQPRPVVEQNRLLLRNLIIAGLMLILNWIYLIIFLP